ncbi:hypothetical protein GCM10009662_33120 [Catellatospora coxensis]|uniref:Uncharacterized protein n=1 Tax=Catellatospora coxensis TaxID=310354 RepID=A0A8J3KTJ8_9ACTN|nr:hypothetical protein Cco03nite_35600 [Catellatospora coxensis]
MSRTARAVTSARLSHCGEPGTESGAHRRQARNPFRAAAAALGKYFTFSALGVRAGHDGRQ